MTSERKRRATPWWGVLLRWRPTAWRGARGLSESCKFGVPRVPPKLEVPVYRGGR